MMRRQLSSIAAKTKALAFPVLLVGALLSTATSFSLAQTEAPLPIRVETREVVVPVFVIDKSYFREDESHRGRTTHIDQDYGKEISGLTAKDFHVFEDGIEQRVQSVAVELPRIWGIRDNVSFHLERSFTPRGIWMWPDWPSQPQLPSQSQIYIHATIHSPNYYMVAYVPPRSPEGSCHRIKVGVDRDKASVSARDEYCNLRNPPFDPLNGTKLGKQMEAKANSKHDGKLPLSVQVVSVFGDTDVSRVHVAIDFSENAVIREGREARLDETIAVLGMVYDTNGALAARFSDSAPNSSTFWLPALHRLSLSPGGVLEELQYLMTPSGYETQIDLHPGDYNLKLVVTDGEKFGRVELPLSVEGYPQESLAVSGIVLCKRFHTQLDAPPAEVRSPEFVPLVSNELVFTPAGDTRFKKGDRLMSYFEIYDPQLGGTGPGHIHLQMRVNNVKTGELETDTGLQAIDSGLQPGNPAIPVAREIVTTKLPKGTHRLEVQASDSAGNKTIWRAASFTIE